MWMSAGAATVIMGLLGVVLTVALYTLVKWGRQSGVDDEQVELLTSLLPGNNCGACGLAGCTAMARALDAGEALPHQCPVANAADIGRLQTALGLSADTDRQPQVARVLCGGTVAVAPQRAIYEGVLDCRAADLVGKGNKACTDGCLGLGTCARTCPFDAITIGEDGLPRVDEARCTGCGLCEAACPRGVIQVMDKAQTVYVRCVSLAAGKRVRAVCQAGCIACGICVRTCTKGKIEMIDNLAWIDPELCVQCGECAEKCPTNAIVDLAAMAQLNGALH